MKKKTKTNEATTGPEPAVNGSYSFTKPPELNEQLDVSAIASICM